MAIRDLLWGCPLCHAPGSIRGARGGERCDCCGARFARDRGALIRADRGGAGEVRAAREWLERLGPVPALEPDPDGRILGPEPVRLKQTTTQEPMYWAGELLGFLERYGPKRSGALELRRDGLFFRPASGDAVRWGFDELTGLQPASSSIQLGLGQGRMASIKFLDTSVRLWTHAIADRVRIHYRETGLDVREFQPHIRTCAFSRSEP